MELVSSVQGLHSGQSKQLEDNVRTGIRKKTISPIRHMSCVSINVVATRTGLFMVALGACRG